MSSPTQNRSASDVCVCPAARRNAASCAPMTCQDVTRLFLFTECMTCLSPYANPAGPVSARTNAVYDLTR